MLHSKIILLLAICIIPALVAMKSVQNQESQQPSSLSPRDLVVLYARTRMDLAQVEFDFASGRLERSISKSRIERYRAELAVAKEQYKQALQASSGGVEKVRLAHAEEKVRLARIDLDAARKLVDGHTASKFRRERAQLRYDLAQIQLELRQNPENYVTLIEALQAQIDQLSQEILNLDFRLTKLEVKF